MKKSMKCVLLGAAITMLTFGTMNIYAAEAETEEVTEIAEEQETALEDGIYWAAFDTDNGMFRVNEVYDGKGLLFVENGEMKLHITLLSKNIVMLYQGTKEEAQAEDAALILPTLDDVTYSDGYNEKVYGFDVPVPVLDEAFTLSLIGKKEKWYQHEVTVSDPVPADEAEAEAVMASWEIIEE